MVICRCYTSFGGRYSKGTVPESELYKDRIRPETMIADNRYKLKGEVII